VNVQEFIQEIATGNLTRSSRLLMTKNPLYWSCAYICPVEKQCEGSCRNANINYPVTIAKLQAYVAEQDRINKNINPEFPAPIGKKVAIIGAGPAGLACAWQLSLKGIESVIFEKRDSAGGMVAWAVPSFRLPDEIRKNEFKRLITPLTTLKTGVSAKSAAELLSDGFDAVLVATGLQASAKARLPGEETARFALEFLDDADSGKLNCANKKVLVIGGGNVAMDVCGTAVRAGASNVELMCMEAPNEMPSCESEIKEAVSEGVIFHTRVMPKEIVVENGVAKGVKCVSIMWKEKDLYAPSNAEEIPGTERFIPADVVVEAIGQRPETNLDALLNGVDRERGLVKVDPSTMETNMKGVYAAGDIVTGGSTVVEAVHQGNTAAANIM
jgi:NADPH-dependent glutamate synthase beta subunit-like oxidoreductase